MMMIYIYIYIYIVKFGEKYDWMRKEKYFGKSDWTVLPDTKNQSTLRGDEYNLSKLFKYLILKFNCITMAVLFSFLLFLSYNNSLNL